MKAGTMLLSIACICLLSAGAYCLQPLESICQPEASLEPDFQPFFKTKFWRAKPIPGSYPISWGTFRQRLRRPKRLPLYCKASGQKNWSSSAPRPTACLRPATPVSERFCPKG